ncbi:aminotransferase class V-fold PLP-dependent enzyme [candidate division KSB3 bacterium]|uniref:Aminotransferase class V-fold PLP-dependent enzyme n=1 Tax=candidate division KSB3 bacterium TaxID=2044937 RepID=A0A9D5JVS9_9BACT|nr:aminotransferase class V-fold PLP-dependent enzyme [candidate division KSB3 bacterium]MBD3324861.1 aminotransferase class V-fold PLP-dependent enzyme [candidate division KSB3 bacterium]
MKAFQLSLPGPTEYDPEVLQALYQPNLPHYGDIWMEIYEQILSRLKQVYQTDGTVYVIPSSGSGALDAVFCSLGPKRGLILHNGTFGDRIATIAGRHLAHRTIIEKAPGEPLPLEEIERTLNEDDYDLLAVVHGETSTGMMNPLDDLAALCRQKDLLFIVDAISSFGGVPLAVDAQGIDFCISASQKALGCLPGLATVSISQKGWDAMPPEDEIHSWYLNLRTWAYYEKAWGDWHPYPITLPVHLFYVLDKALELILQEGLEARWQRHQQVAEQLYQDLEALGISLFIEDKSYRLPTVTAGVLPEGFSSEGLQKFLREHYGIMVAGGVGPLRKSVFRIGHMGYSAQPWLVNRVVSAIRDYLHTK